MKRSMQGNGGENHEASLKQRGPQQRKLEQGQFTIWNNNRVSASVLMIFGSLGYGTSEFKSGYYIRNCIGSCSWSICGKEN